MANEFTLSFQKINAYSRCGLQYYFRYIENLKIPPTPNVAVGSAVHQATEVFYLKKKEKRENPKLELMLDTYSDTLENLFLEEMLLDDDEMAKGKDKIKSELKDAGIRVLRVYYNQKAINLDPLYVEEEFLLSLERVAREMILEDKHLSIDPNKLVGVYVLGYVDLVSTDNRVIDLKTRRSRPGSDEVEKSQQLTIYALGFRELLGRLPEKVVLENLILPHNKSSMGNIVSLESMRTEEDIKRLLRRVVRVVDGIRKGVFIPPDQGSWACKYCGYRRLNICKEYLH